MPRSGLPPTAGRRRWWPGRRWSSASCPYAALASLLPDARVEPVLRRHRDRRGDEPWRSPCAGGRRPSGGDLDPAAARAWPSSTSSGRSPARSRCCSSSTTSSGATARRPPRSRSPCAARTSVPVALLAGVRTGVRSAASVDADRGGAARRPRRSDWRSGRCRSGPSAGSSSADGPARGRALVTARIAEAAGGNPLLALELARAIDAAGPDPAPGEPLAIPASAEPLIADRLGRLSRRRRRRGPGRGPGRQRHDAAILRVAVRRRRRGAGVDEALRAGLLDLDGEVVRLGHPLVGRRGRRTGDPRAATGDPCAARAARRPTRRPRPAPRPRGGRTRTRDAAAACDAAADDAERRGAPAAAAELAELAVGLTASGRPRPPGGPTMSGGRPARRRRRPRPGAREHLEAGLAVADDAGTTGSRSCSSASSSPTSSAAGPAARERGRGGPRGGRRRPDPPGPGARRDARPGGPRTPREERRHAAAVARAPRGSRGRSARSGRRRARDPRRRPARCGRGAGLRPARARARARSIAAGLRRRIARGPGRRPPDRRPDRRGARVAGPSRWRAWSGPATSRAGSARSPRWRGRRSWPAITAPRGALPRRPPVSSPPTSVPTRPARASTRPTSTRCSATARRFGRPRPRGSPTRRPPGTAWVVALWHRALGIDALAAGEPGLAADHLRRTLGRGARARDPRAELGAGRRRPRRGPRRAPVGSTRPRPRSPSSACGRRPPDCRGRVVGARPRHGRAPPARDDLDGSARGARRGRRRRRRACRSPWSERGPTSFAVSVLRRLRRVREARAALERRTGHVRRVPVATVGGTGRRRARPAGRARDVAGARSPPRSARSPSWRQPGARTARSPTTLVVSVRTVESQLSAVYAKLGVRGRAALARALDRGGGAPRRIGRGPRRPASGGAAPGHRFRGSTG